MNTGYLDKNGKPIHIGARVLVDGMEAKIIKKEDGIYARGDIDELLAEVLDDGGEVEVID